MTRDRRIKAPGLMSAEEFADHMARWHPGTRVTRWAHQHSHSIDPRTHGHRPMLLSETDHPDWAVAR